jgi:y4mF family transcriptional regulator
MRVTDSKSFGNAIRKRRKELGYTQRDLSEFSGLSISFLSDLERGKKTIELEKALYVISILGLNLNLEPRIMNEPVREGL